MGYEPLNLLKRLIMLSGSCLSSGLSFLSGLSMAYLWLIGSSDGRPATVCLHPFDYNGITERHSEIDGSSNALDASGFEMQCTQN